MKRRAILKEVKYLPNDPSKPGTPVRMSGEATTTLHKSNFYA